MKKRLLCFGLCLLLLFLASCGADYTGDERLGEYVSESYRLSLFADGKGTLVHTSAYDVITEEAILFTFEADGTLVVHGTEKSGGVIGRTEWYGLPERTADGYVVSLRAVDTGVVLGRFTQQ